MFGRTQVQPQAGRRLLVGLLAAFALLAAAGPSAYGQTADAGSQSSTAPPVPYLVTFAPGVSDADQASALAAAGATDVSDVAPLRMHSVDLPGDSYQSSVSTLEADSSVERVEPDASRSISGVPDDAGYDQQWSLSKIGWDQVYGSVAPSGTATVAVLDTGVDASHPDLAGQVVPGTSILDPSSDGTTDPNGHGTGMAGIVAADTNNGAGIAGIGYAGVRVMPVTVLGADGTGQDSDIIQGVVWAADHGADVILMAFSNPGYSASLQDAIDYAWSKGVVLVAATGNDASSTANFPSGDRGVVGVGNTDMTDALDPSSNYGPDMFMTAPGDSIYTTWPGGGYTTLTGTSASAAEVAGAAALMKASSPGASNGVIVDRLARNADPITSSFATTNGRLDLARSIADTSTDAIEPAGAAPVGSGGPVVGPYVAASQHILTVSLGNQSPNPLQQGASATFAITSTWNGSGTDTATLGVTGLPSGATASFSPSTLSQASPNSTLTISTTGSLASGTYPFTVTTSGAAVQSSGTVSASGSLVVGGAPTKLAITSVNSGSNVTAGTAFNVAVQSQDSSGNPASVASATSFSLSLKTGNGTLGGTLTGTIPAGSSTATVTGVTYTKAETGVVLTATRTAGDSLAAGDSAPFTVVAGAASKYLVTAATNSPVAGAADVISAQLADANGNAVKTSGVTVDWSKGGAGGGSLSAASTTTDANGIAQVTLTSDETAGTTVTVTAGDGTHSGTSANITTVVGPAAKYLVTAATNSPVAGAGDLISAQLTDANGNPVATSGVSVSWGGTGSGTFSSASTLTNASGVAQVTLTTGTTAGQTYAVTATDGSSRTGTSADITTVAGPASQYLVTETPASPVAGAGVAVSAQLADVNGNAVSTSGRTVAWSLAGGTGGSFSPTTSNTNSSGIATTTFTTGTVAGTTYSVKADDGTFSGTSTSFTTVAGAATKIRVETAADGTGVVVAAQSLTAGNALTLYAIARDTNGNFVGNVAADAWSLPAKTGGVANGDLVASGDSKSATFTGHLVGTATIRAAESGLTATDSGTITVVHGTASQVALTGLETSLSEGDTRDFTATVQDGAGNTVDDFTGNVTFAKTTGAGTVTGLGTQAALAGVATRTVTGNGAGSVTLRASIGSGAGEIDSNTRTFSVANVAPTVTLSGPASAAEGSKQDYSFTVSDPGTGETFTLQSESCGTGNVVTGANIDASTGAGGFSCTFADGPSSPNVTVTVSDGTDTGTDSKTVGVTNVAPTATLGNDGPVDEGSAATVSFTNQSDPSSGDTAAGFHYAYSCSDGDLSAATYASTSGSSASTTCTYPDGPSDHTVSARIIDRDGGHTDYTTSVHVDNVPPSTPSLVAPADGAATNDATPKFDWSDATDPGVDDTITYAIQAKRGGCDFTTGTLALDVSGLASSDLTPSGDLADGTYCWRVRATDKDGANSDWSTTRTVTIDTVTTVAFTHVTTPVYTANVTSAGATGTSEAGDTIDLKVSDATSDVTGSTVADSSGAWTFSNVDLSGLADGSITYSAKATDGVGNIATASNVATKDTVVPLSHIVFPVDGTTYSAGNYATGCTTGQICGTASDTGSGVAGVDVAIRQDTSGTWWDGSGFTQASADYLPTGGADAWSYGFTPPADGGYTVLSRATDNAGNVEGAPDVAHFDQAGFTYDTSTNVAIASFSDPVSGGNVAAAQVTGTSEAGDTIALTVGDGTHTVTGSATADGSGNWSITGLDLEGLSDGPITYGVVATDLVGNTAPDSHDALKDTVTNVSLAHVTDPVFSGNATGADVTGSAEAGDTVDVTVTDSASNEVHAQTVATGGNWSVSGLDLSGLADGQITYRAHATDAVGNTADADPVSALKDTVTHVAITHVTDPVYSGNVTGSGLSGTAEPGDKVDYEVSDHTSEVTGSAVADDSGAWTAANVDLSALVDGPITYGAHATDAVGNTADATPVPATKDTVTNVSIDSATDPVTHANEKSAGIGGTAEAGDTVALTVSDGTHEVADSAVATGGNWSMTGLDLSSLTDGSITYEVNATDAAGNTAQDSKGAVKDTVTTVSITHVTDPVYSGNVANADVTGSAEAGDTVDVKVTDGSHDVTGSAVATGGDWSVSGLDLSGLDDGQITYSAHATDAVGNVADTSKAATKDTVAPTTGATATKADTSGYTDGDWTNQSVTLALTPVDPDPSSGLGDTHWSIDDSGSNTGTNVLVATSLGNGPHTVSYSSQDVAGNAETPNSFTVRIDTAKPGSTASSPQYASGSNIDVGYSAHDTGGSGLTTVELYVKRPGHTSYELAGTQNPTGDGPVSGTFHYDVATDGSGDGTYSFFTRSLDAAGNEEVAPGTPDSTTTVTSTLQDTAAPSSKASSPAYDKSGTIHVTSGATDPGTEPSGIASVDLYVKAPGGAWTKADSNTGGNFDYSPAAGADGAYGFYTIAHDNAGNSEPAKSAAESTTFEDRAAPSSDITDAPAATKDASFDVTYSLSDPDPSSGAGKVEIYASTGGNAAVLVGTDSTPADGNSVSVTLPSSDDSYALYSRATDAAGNVEDAPATPDKTVVLDTHAPSSAITAAPHYTNSAGFDISYSLSDPSPSSGFDKVRVYASTGANAAVLVGTDSAPHDGDTVHVTLPSGAADGNFDLYSVASDLAGNSEAAPGSPDATVLLDTHAPATTASGSNADTTTYDSGDWTKQDVTVGFTATDPAPGSGVDLTHFTLDAGADQTGSSASVTAEGVHTVSYWSVDKAGNEETPHNSFTVKIDRTPPTTTASATKSGGGTYSSGDWTNKDVTLTLSPTDTGSNVDQTHYSVDGGPDATGTSVAITTAGAHTVRYYSVDKLGNTESTRTFNVNVDRTAPSTSAAASTAGGSYTAGTWTNADVKLAFTPSDSGGSGVAATYYAVDSGSNVSGANVTLTANGTHTVTYWSVDTAGNEETPHNTFAVDIDKTAPTATISSPTDSGTYIKGSALSSNASCFDALSGISSCTASIFFGGVTSPASLSGSLDTSTVGAHTYKVSATDNAGNTGSNVASYTVIYNSNGQFMAPVYNVPSTTMNSVKAGQAVPLKFTLHGNQGLSIFASGYPQSQQIMAPAGTDTSPLATDTAGNSSLSYDATSDTYTYVWKTDKSWANTTRQLVILLNDGVTYFNADFKFTK